MNSPSYCLQKMLWQYTYEIYINTLIAIIYFLSKHHLQGGDREQHSKTIALVISIHTTRKVVTLLFPPLFVKSGNFNPHHPQGGDYDTLEQVDNMTISIHTTRKVVTNTHYLEVTGGMISIHTTRKVVTYCYFFITSPFAYFNPHHPQGGDKSPTLVFIAFLYFNPHHPQGGDSIFRFCTVPELSLIHI